MPLQNMTSKFSNRDFYWQFSAITIHQLAMTMGPMVAFPSDTRPEKDKD